MRQRGAEWFLLSIIGGSVAVMLTAGCGGEVESRPAKMPEGILLPPDQVSTNQQPLLIDQMSESSCPVPTGFGTDTQHLLRLNNRIRKALGFVGCADLNKTMTAATTNMAYYASSHSWTDCYTDAHTQKPICSSYTGASPLDRVITQGGLPSNIDFLGDCESTSADQGDESTLEWHMDSLFNAPLHRGACFMDSRTTIFGANQMSVWRWLVVPVSTVTMNIAMPIPSGPRAFAVWPKPFQTGVPRSWSGIESPQPPVPPTGWPSGYAISLFQEDLNAINLILEDIGPEGNASPVNVPIMAAHSGNMPAYVEPGMYHFYAHKVLKPNNWYRATVVGNRWNAPVVHQWPFKTGSQ